MSTFKKIAITNRLLCSNPFLEQIEKILPKIDLLILREKDLKEEDYEKLARQVLSLCEMYKTPCVLHSYIEAAQRLKCRSIHLPLWLLEQNAGSLGEFHIIGASVHSAKEAIKAQQLGATYLTAGHIFPTECKKGLPPRGIAFLKEICDIVSIPVYALGGITEKTLPLLSACGAAGACRMSDYMKLR